MLTPEQIKHYDENGYVVLNDIFTPEEVALLRYDAKILQTPRRGHPDANVIEKDGTTVRSAWAPEIDSSACAAFYRLPRILGPVKQLLGEDVYLYQSRLNYKAARTGDLFQWHQDYQAWWMDGVPRGGHRDILTVMIMLDESTHDNGPLKFIPGSHKDGMILPSYDTETTSYALYMIPDKEVEEKFGAMPVYENIGKAGMVVIFSANVVHSSGKNFSDKGRRILYFAYNRDDNRPVTEKSRRTHANKFIMNPHPDKLDVVPDHSLRQLAEA